jgi:hypothetical protein
MIVNSREKPMAKDALSHSSFLVTFSSNIEIMHATTSLHDARNKKEVASAMTSLQIEA